MSIMHYLDIRSLAIFSCLISFQLSVTDANPIYSSQTAIVDSSRYRQSGRKLVNLQRFIRKDPNLKEDYQQFDIGATSEPEIFVPTTEDSPVVLEQEDFDNAEASTIPNPASSVISVASGPSEELSSLSLDVDFQDTTESITPMSGIQDVSITPVFDTTESIANELEDLSVNSETETLVDILITTPQVLIEEMELPSSTVSPTFNPTDPPPSHLQTSVPIASSEMPNFTSVAPTDATTEISKSKKLDYSSFTSNEEEHEEQENISYIVIEHLPEITTELNAPSNPDEEEYPVDPEMVTSKSLANIVENPSTTETPAQSTSDLLDFPLFYPAIRLENIPKKPDVNVDPLPLNPSWPVKTGDSYSADQQLLTQLDDKQQSSELENKMRPQSYPKVVVPQFKPSQPLYPDYVPTSFYTFGSTVQPNQPKFRQATATYSHGGPPRAPYPHPHGNNSPFYRPFDSAPPKPRMLIFPPISNTRENFRFRVNWADELGRSDWA